MKTVIVGLEETEESRDALVFASAFAKATGAELNVVAVLPFETLLVGPDEYEKARDQHFDRVLAVAESSVEGDYVPHRIDDISPAAALTTIAEEKGAEAIVIGSSHLGAFGRVVLGSVGERLSAGAPCPVIVVPRGYGRRQAGLSAIGVGYDGTPESETALAAAAELARGLGSSLRLIAVTPELWPAGRIAGTSRGYEQILHDDAAARLAEAPGLEGLEVERELRTGDAADQLADASSRLDLLVVGSRGYGPLRRVLLGGVSARLMRSAGCPLLVLPRASEKGPARHRGMPEGASAATAG